MDEVAASIAEGGEPFLVAVDGERVLGWAKLSRYSSRDYYAGVKEASIYVDAEARGRGVGRTLLAELEREAQRRGNWKLVGLVFPENAPSLSLFRAAGWREVGFFHRHGVLDGRWRDVLLVERSLGEAAAPGG